MDRANRTIRSSPFAIRHSAMTLIELLIVIVIIGVLAGAVLLAATSLIGKSKTRNTQAVLQIVADAVEQFKRSETEKPTITKHARYKARYGLYPPDELEVFASSPAGVPGASPPTGSLTAPSLIFPSPQGARYASSMRFYSDGTAANDALEHRDLAALIVAIESQGGEAAAILEKISDRNRSAGVLNPANGEPAQFLDRPQGINAGPTGGWNADDLQIRYILDDWDVPIGYMAQRDFVHNANPPTPTSSNHPNWNEASTEFVRINGGQPLIFSYGANGKDQLKQEAMGADGKASMPGDFTDHKIDDPFNDDNVYLNEQLREKLSTGIEEHG